MKTSLGYGRYDDDPDYVGCPRARSDMTPCIARDGQLALADTGACVACGIGVFAALSDVYLELGRSMRDFPLQSLVKPEVAADELSQAVRELTQPLVDQSGPPGATP